MLYKIILLISLAALFTGCRDIGFGIDCDVPAKVEAARPFEAKLLANLMLFDTTGTRHFRTLDRDSIVLAALLPQGWYVEKATFTVFDDMSPFVTDQDNLDSIVLDSIKRIRVQDVAERADISVKNGRRLHTFVGHHRFRTPTGTVDIPNDSLNVGLKWLMVYCWMRIVPNCAPGQYSIGFYASLNPDDTVLTDYRDSVMVEVTGPVIAIVAPDATPFDLNITPSPMTSTGTLNFRLPDNADGTAVLYDARGRLMLSQILRGIAGWNRLPLSKQLGAGSYIMQLSVGSKTTSKQIIIIH